MVQRGVIFLCLFLAVQAVWGQQGKTSPRESAGGREQSVAHKDTFPGSEAMMNKRLRRALGLGESDTLETVFHLVLSNLPRFAPPGYIHQKQVRNRVQRSAATAIAFDLATGDGIGALLQTIKLKLEIAYAMPHRTFTVFDIPLPDSWEFPDDPWRHEWWMDR